MGPLLFCGLVTFGAAVAIGIIAAGAPRPAVAGGMTPTRRLVVILIALASGCGIWGAVVACLAAASGPGRGSPPGDLAAAPFVAVLPILGAVIAIALMMAAFARLDPWVLTRSVGFILPQVALTIVAAILTLVLPAAPATRLDTSPFVVLGVVAAGAVIGLGLTGQRAVIGLASLEGSAPESSAIRAAINRGFARCVPFELAAVGAAVIAIVLVVTAR